MRTGERMGHEMGCELEFGWMMVEVKVMKVG
jgi:hypothetical protein